MNVLDILRDQAARRLDNGIKDAENVADVFTEEGFGPLDAVKNAHRRFYESNGKLLNDFQRLFG